MLLFRHDPWSPPRPLSFGVCIRHCGLFIASTHLCQCKCEYNTTPRTLTINIITFTHTLTHTLTHTYTLLIAVYTRSQRIPVQPAKTAHFPGSRNQQAPVRVPPSSTTRSLPPSPSSQNTFLFAHQSCTTSGFSLPPLCYSRTTFRRETEAGEYDRVKAGVAIRVTRASPTTVKATCSALRPNHHGLPPIIYLQLPAPRTMIPQSY